MDKITEKPASYRRYEKIRDKKKATDYRIAKETGIARATLSSWSHGLYEPKLDKKIKIAKALGITLEELVGVR